MSEDKKELEGGALTDRVSKEIYFSTRGIPLITQSLDRFFGRHAGKPHLTVENHNKWYCAYAIYPDGTVTPIYDVVSDEDIWSWEDHCISPRAFHDTAVHYGLVYDSFTFALVCEMFVEDIMEGDWSKLQKHLPLTDLPY